MRALSPALAFDPGAADAVFAARRRPGATNAQECGAAVRRPGASASPAVATAPAPAASSSSVRHARVRVAVLITASAASDGSLVLKPVLRRERAFPLGVREGTCRNRADVRNTEGNTRCMAY